MAKFQTASASADDPGSAEPAELQQELATQKDNFRKRTRRDSEQQAAAAKDAFILDLLPIFDNLERALDCEQMASPAQLHQGVKMTLQEASRLLQRHGIAPDDDGGRPFDPHRHEAVSIGHDSRQPDQAILAVVQRGYSRGDKMFRPAKVIVNELSNVHGGGRAH